MKKIFQHKKREALSIIHIPFFHSFMPKHISLLLLLFLMMMMIKNEAIKEFKVTFA
jgi:hypothetical protein